METYFLAKHCAAGAPPPMEHSEAITILAKEVLRLHEQLRLANIDCALAELDK